MMISRALPLLVVVVILLMVNLGEGYPFSPFAEYHLCMMSGLRDETLNVECFRTEEGTTSNEHLDSALNGPMVIPAHNSYNWSFHPNIVGGTVYHCSADYASADGRRYRLDTFDAFHDSPSFVDDLCGGRHCIWKFSPEGVYLYNIMGEIYVLMYKWIRTQM